MAHPLKSFGSVTLTRGVRIAVAPRFEPEQSEPGVFVFSYRIRITNETPGPVRLLSRRWLIVDAAGQKREVRGDGVVGQQPELPPGGVFTYSSYCPLTTPSGTMEGQYTMVGADGERFEVEIGRFTLAAPGEHGA